MSLDRKLPLNRLKRVPRSAPDFALEGVAVELTDADSVTVIAKPEDFSWRSWAVFLLHTGAEVEHSLLVQYLYAAYSIRPNAPGDPPPNRSTWSRALAKIAKEEMGHLLTVQNILRALRAPLNLEREDFPFRSKLYPFPYRLERLTRMSLAKYVLAEMPPEGVPENVLPATEKEQLVQLASLDNGGGGINQVGLLYDTIRHALTQLTPDQFHADPAGGPVYQSGANDWQGSTSEDPTNVTGIKTIIVIDQPSALSAVDVIARQGEGAGGADLANAHFKRFLDIYRQFPPENAGDSPTFPAPTDPNTAFPPNSSTIIHPVTRRWATLFNLRYGILLSALSHALHTPVSTDRDLLMTWVFEEMIQSPGSIKDLCGKLLTLDMDELTGRKAGGPFELPPSMSWPDREQDWWLLHLDAIHCSRQLIDLLAQPTDALLTGILDRDGRTPTEGRRKEIGDRLAGFP